MFCLCRFQPLRFQQPATLLGFIHIKMVLFVNKSWIINIFLLNVKKIPINKINVTTLTQRDRQMARLANKTSDLDITLSFWPLRIPSTQF